MDTQSGLGKLIRDARQRRGWTQRELADRLGLDKAQVSLWETGARKWPQEHVRAIAQTLGLSQVKMAIAAGIIDGPEDAAEPARAEPSPGYESVLYVMDRMEEREREALAKAGDLIIGLREAESVATPEPERVPALA